MGLITKERSFLSCKQGSPKLSKQGSGASAHPLPVLASNDCIQNGNNSLSFLISHSSKIHNTIPLPNPNGSGAPSTSVTTLVLASDDYIQNGSKSLFFSDTHTPRRKYKITKSIFLLLPMPAITILPFLLLPPQILHHQNPPRYPPTHIICTLYSQSALALQRIHEMSMHKFSPSHQ